MRCKAARVFIQETLDGPLPPPDEAMLEAHIAGCEACRNYKIALGRIASGLGRLEPCGAPRDFSAIVTFQLAREKRRRQWAPLAAAAVVVAGLVTLKPMLGGTGFQVASQGGDSPTVQSNVGLAGSSLLGGLPARPERLAGNSQPASEHGLADEAGQAAPLPATGDRPDGFSEAGSGAGRKGSAESRAIASLPAGVGAGASGLAAHPAGATALRSRPGALSHRALTPEEQMAVDMATFEMLRWMDPAADGGPHLEFQEVDFTLP